MAGAALQIVPAGAKQIAPGVYQAPRARRGRGGRLKKAFRRSSKHGFFSRQWFWFALALVLGEVFGRTLLKSMPRWISVPALLLYAYGVAKKKPGAINAAYAIQAAKLANSIGLTDMLVQVGAKTLRLQPAAFEGPSGDGGGGGFIPASAASDVAEAADIVRAIQEVV